MPRPFAQFIPPCNRNPAGPAIAARSLRPCLMMRAGWGSDLFSLHVTATGKNVWSLRTICELTKVLSSISCGKA
jgi:hypothetical protein